MSFIIDASIALSWNYPDEANALSDAILEKLESDNAFAPGIFWFEIRNVLVLGERRGRSTQAATDEFLEFLKKLPIDIVPLPFEAAAADLLSLARKHRLTFYDAAYLELAQREGVALATLDKALARAATAEHIALLGA